MWKVKILLIVLILHIAIRDMAQHYIGFSKEFILTQQSHNPEVKKLVMQPETFKGDTADVLIYYFKDRTQYYYINKENGICLSYASFFNSPTAKDSLMCIYDAKYERVASTSDTTSIMWIEYCDGINYLRVLRDFKPPTCVVILGVDKKVDY